MGVRFGKQHCTVQHIKYTSNMSDQMSEMDRKKAEVRKRMEEEGRMRKKKKGFMTPEGKKKLRLLLRKKAAEELKKEQERKAAERRKVIDQRCGKPTSTDGMSESQLMALCQEYHERICNIESEKYDTEKEVEFKDYQISELNIAVNDLRGKFIKTTLKKVSKYEKKFAMDDDQGKEEHKKPDWALGEKEGKSKSVSEVPAEIPAEEEAEDSKRRIKYKIEYLVHDC